MAGKRTASKDTPVASAGYLSYCDSYGAYRTIEIGSPDWFAWLDRDDVRLFAFARHRAQITVRKERKQRGSVYWVAYKAAGGLLQKKYLGKSENVTNDKLHEVAADMLDIVKWMK